MRVLVGFDGSAGAHDAVALARQFCRDGRGALLVNVLPHGGSLPGEYHLVEHPESDGPEGAEGVFADARAELAGI